MEQALAMEVMPLVVPMLGCEELLSARLVSKEMCELASEDHAWAGKLQALFEDFPLDKDEASRPEFPPRAVGALRDDHSYIPVESELQHLVQPRFPRTNGRWGNGQTLVEDGVLKDIFLPAEDDVQMRAFFGIDTQVWVARPLPLRCESCGVVCETYDSFAAHCALWAHKGS
ncbi:hypothetical protein T492DRAFT_1124953 [Pavlovales sp. CCMP2436]|nr:hypothetical protein T492DRAFT_1124953 [Pavlovales sp. CCMP2436]